MPVKVLAIGKLRSGPVSSLARDYIGRINTTGGLLGSLEVIEMTASQAKTAQLRKRQEANDFRSRLRDVEAFVVCDSTGVSMNSVDFSVKLKSWMRRVRKLGILIGGPDGIDPDLRDQAFSVLSLGAMTWPHALARVMLLEQLYRAECIDRRHPYHR